MKTRRPTALLAAAVASALLAASCASTPGSDEAEAASDATTQVADAGGTFRASLSLPFEQATDAEGLHTIAVSVEGPMAVYCHVWPEETELGVTALQITQSVFESITAAEGVSIPELRLVAVEAGEIGGTAYQSLKTAFRLASGEETGVGLMKVAVAHEQGRGITCQHWASGRVEIFDRVFEELVRSFQVTEPGPEPFYTEITRILADGVVVGVNVTTFRRDDEGDVQGVAETSLTIPTSPSDLAVHYSKTTDWSGSDGELINAYEFASDLESEHTSLSLSPTAQGTWRVVGVYENEEVEADLEPEGAIDSMLSDMLAMKYALVPRGERASVTLLRWLPDADPAGLTELPIRVDPEDPHYLSMEAGGFAMRAKRDDEGLPESTSLEAGQVTMTFERIYQDGGI